MQARGFTLVEVLVVMTISAILLALAVPSFRSIIRTSQISSASNTMLASLDLSRSEAIRRNVVVVLCRSLNPQAPQPVCSGAAGNGYAADDWASGWVVFAKAPGNANAGQFEAGDEVVSRQVPLTAAVQERLIVEWAGVARRSFGANGLLTQLANTTIFIDHRDTQVATRSEFARCIAVNVAGRARVAAVVNDLCPAA